MKLNTILTLGLGLTMGGAVSAADYTIDPAHTYPSFAVSHLGFSTMRGKFDSSSGTMSFDPDAKTGSVSITIDASSVDTGHGKRDDHLRSPDFFNTAEFPEITFKSNGVSFNGGVLSEVRGDLTILGVSRPVVLEVTSMNCGEHPLSKKHTCGFNANTTVKRTDFGMNYAVPGIGDEIVLDIEVEAARN